jgi:RNA polymerase sigma-70 factor (ECF subfamily)
VTDDGTDPIERLYREQSPKLWRALFAWSSDPEVASDAVAEAFMQLLGRGGAVRAPQAWVWRSAFKIAGGILKERHSTSGEADMPDMIVTPVEADDDLLTALAALTPMQRASIVLHHYAGYRAGEVAAIVGSTAPAVRVHLSVGRRRLRSLLSEEVHEDV